MGDPATVRRWVKNAVATIFKNWRSTQPKSTQSKEHAQVIERILDAIHSHGDSRFSDWNWTPSVNRYGGFSEEPVVYNRMGYWDESGGSRIYLFFTGALREVIKGFDFNRAVKALNDAGAIVQKNPGRHTKRERVKGESTYFYCIDPKSWRLLRSRSLKHDVTLKTRWRGQCAVLYISCEISENVSTIARQAALVKDLAFALLRDFREHNNSAR